MAQAVATAIEPWATGGRFSVVWHGGEPLEQQAAGVAFGYRQGELALGERAQQERAIDLDAIDGEAVHVAERRVAGAEVVDAQAEPLALQRLELPLRDNVAPHGASDEDVRAALADAGADGLADLDTPLAKQYTDGIDLSGGQWQRIALARALCGEKGMQIGSDGVQLLGGHGFVKEHPVERWYRDLRAAGLMEGALLV